MAKQKMVVRVTMEDAEKRTKALKIAVGEPGVISAALEGEKIVVVGDGLDSVKLTVVLRKKMGFAELVSLAAAEEKKEETKKKADSEEKKEETKKKADSEEKKEETKKKADSEEKKVPPVMYPYWTDVYPTYQPVMYPYQRVVCPHCQPVLAYDNYYEPSCSLM